MGRYIGATTATITDVHTAQSDRDSARYYMHKVGIILIYNRSTGHRCRIFYVLYCCILKKNILLLLCSLHMGGAPIGEGKIVHLPPPPGTKNIMNL